MLPISFLCNQKSLPFHLKPRNWFQFFFCGPNNFRSEDYVSDSWSDIIMAEDLKAESTYSKILDERERKKEIIIIKNKKERKKRQSGLPLLPQRENWTGFRQKKYLIKLVSVALILCQLLLVIPVAF